MKNYKIIGKKIEHASNSAINIIACASLSAKKKLGIDHFPVLMANIEDLGEVLLASTNDGEFDAFTKEVDRIIAELRNNNKKEEL